MTLNIFCGPAQASPRCSGLTENDGHENDGPSKLQGMKLQDVKMTDQVAGHENARHENAGHENTAHENARHHELFQWRYVHFNILTVYVFSLLTTNNDNNSARRQSVRRVEQSKLKTAVVCVEHVPPWTLSSSKTACVWGGGLRE